MMRATALHCKRQAPWLEPWHGIPKPLPLIRRVSILCVEGLFCVTVSGCVLMFECWRQFINFTIAVQPCVGINKRTQRSSCIPESSGIHLGFASVTLLRCTKPRVFLKELLHLQRKTRSNPPRMRRVVFHEAQAEAQVI